MCWLILSYQPTRWSSFSRKNVLGKITGIKTIESKLKAFLFILSIYHTVVGQFHHFFHFSIHIEIIQDSNPVFKVHGIWFCSYIIEN